MIREEAFGSTGAKSTIMIDYTAVSRELPAKITGTAADGGAVAFMFQAPG